MAFLKDWVKKVDIDKNEKKNIFWKNTAKIKKVKKQPPHKPPKKLTWLTESRGSTIFKEVKAIFFATK